ncbi:MULTISPECIES: helicase-exonuclease AddAB subunit AddB [Desulfitobacterium]|uniref:ATP-dependent helicase/deoxyribonuclease subunit B n=1 Tax=Desulfitobacterium dehalogenans (strain ATCC 51507 / DSM 9161 / JW/IU-DC1) TaxID=756499 RepID=I4A9J6_DESDJ|nr:MULTISPECIES: helicase-exonuclease AddAB subunit AddB [Desulfitobacterium]AFM00631.1 DNA helicase/exodeoxyribonuclease V, subunit B [Desulfitobacterium dehalogenans ATCC 51507]
MRFILGRAGTGKSTLCLNEIRRESQENPEGLPLILLVPEQATHQMEMSLAHDPQSGGILRAQVLSFRRLGWRVFSELGGGGKTPIGEVGKRMLLRRLLLKYRSDLRVFARSATRPGMADLLAQAIAEFKIYRITPDQLRGIQDSDELLLQKTYELAFLYEELNKSLGFDVRDPDDELNLVAEKISQAPFLHGARIWVDGFKGFTPQEFYIIQSMLGTVSEITISLPLDPELIKGRNPQFKPGEELFYEPFQTYQGLVNLARDSKSRITYVELTETHRFQNAGLKHLERFYNAYPTKAFKSGGSTDLYPPGIALFPAANKRAEIEGIARELRRLAREEGKMWRDCSVVTRDLAGYQGIIEQVFHAHDIPYFLDHKRPVIHHPLLELLLSAIEAVQTDWAYEPLFRCLKTDFFPCSKDRIDRLENYCLAYGIHGSAWRGNHPWKYYPDPKDIEEAENLNEVRRIIYEILSPLEQALRPHHEACGSPVTVAQITEAIYELLIRLKVPEHLQDWAEVARSRGDLAEAQLQNQIWDAVIQVLDEMVASLGEEVMDLADFAMILTSGLENLKLGLIPPGYDQVLVGSLDRSRNPETAVLFLLGANDGILPGKPSNEGVFDELERLRLERKGIILAPKGKVQVYEEHYFIYTALTRAKERLYISYPLTDEEGRGLTVSPVINRMKAIFPGLQERYLSLDTEDLDLIPHPYALLPAYALHLQKLRQGTSLSPLWQAIRSWFLTKTEAFPQVLLLEKGISDQNHEEKLPQPLARQLYGKRLVTSVSRLEQFARCPFAHFAQYGLKLKERSNYRLSPPDMGQFFHAVLHDYAVALRERELDWGELNKEQSWQLVNEAADQIVLQLQNKILLSNARYRYLTHKLKRTVHHAVRVLGEHARQGEFVPIELEVKFGPQDTLPPLEVELSGGSSLILRGQIDRIDGAILGNEIYLRILDYKSREAHVNLNQIYYGLDLQLLAYLDAALQGAQILLSSSSLPEAFMDSIPKDTSQDLKSLNNIHPAGFLYFPVLEPQLKSKTLLYPEELEKDRIKAVKVKGYLLADRQVLMAMDRDLENSNLLGVKFNKNGEFKKGSPTLTEEQFALLRRHLQYFLRRSGEALLNGDISITPYKQGKNTACQFCSYKPLCHFDPYLPENKYRNLPVIQDEDFWNRVESQDSEQYVSVPDSLASDQKSPLKDTDNSQRTQELIWLGEDEAGAGKEDNLHE